MQSRVDNPWSRGLTLDREALHVVDGPDVEVAPRDAREVSAPLPLETTQNVEQQLDAIEPVLGACRGEERRTH